MNAKALTDVDTSTSVDNIFVNDSGKVRQVSKETLSVALKSAGGVLLRRIMKI